MTKNLLKNIVHYATSYKNYLANAIIEFFGESEPKEFGPFANIVDGLFLEWYIFDYKDENGEIFIKKYLDKNPNNLDEKLLNEIRQIADTQSYQMFQIENTEPNSIVNVYGMEMGETYRVKDYHFAKNFNANIAGGCIFARVAKIKDMWYFVGSDTINMPVEFTNRMKKMLKGKKHGPTDTLLLIRENVKTNKDFKNEHRGNVYVDIKQKRKELEEIYNKLKQEYNFKVGFSEIKELVYFEKYNDNVSDYTTDILKLVSKKSNYESVLKNMQVFIDIWNFFPHKNLNKMCPQEVSLL